MERWLCSTWRYWLWRFDFAISFDEKTCVKNLRLDEFWHRWSFFINLRCQYPASCRLGDLG
jgi:hypothetical protein